MVVVIIIYEGEGGGSCMQINRCNVGRCAVLRSRHQKAGKVGGPSGEQPHRYAKGMRKGTGGVICIERSVEIMAIGRYMEM